MASWKLFLVDSFPQFVLSILVFFYDFQLQDWTYLKSNPLQLWEIVGIYGISMFFILKNVIPKFVSFGGARRHYNDVKNVEKAGLRKFMTKNYIRLAFHILSGAMQVTTSGGYVLLPHFWNTIFSFKFLQSWFIFWDLIHETTGWLMTRNHDGIFAIRAYNLAFMVVKLFFCGQISKMTSADSDFIALVGGLFILTSGFAWVRFTCSLIAIAQVAFYKVDFTKLRENWYSLGLWVGQYAIAFRTRTLGEMHLFFAFCAVYFPIELWIKSRAKHKFNTMLVTFSFSALYFIKSPVVQHWQHEIQSCIGVIYLVYTTWFCGVYWKRSPIPGVDFDATKKTRETKEHILRQSASYRGVIPAFVSNFITTKTQKRIQSYNKEFKNFTLQQSASRSIRQSASRSRPRNVGQRTSIVNKKKMLLTLLAENGLENANDDLVKKIFALAGSSNLVTPKSKKTFQHPMMFADYSSFSDGEELVLPEDFSTSTVKTIRSVEEVIDEVSYRISDKSSGKGLEPWCLGELVNEFSKGYSRAHAHY